VGADGILQRFAHSNN
jgi:hypothetical protein